MVVPISEMLGRSGEAVLRDACSVWPTLCALA
jgi:hypothetical protein